MLPKDKWNQFSEEGLDVKGITIHNTNSDLTLDEIYNYLMTTKNNNGCHFLIDHEKIVEVLPLNRWCYHTGKGKDWGNLHTIAIEICSNKNPTLYKKGQDRAVNFIKDLMNHYNFGKYDIFFHNDFDTRAYCPNDILQIYKTKENFIKEEF